MPRVSEQTSCDHPKVSVDMITYNHEKYIAEAIESVLMQETDFPVELIIGEDYSTDGTRRIVKAYAEKYPNVIRALLPDHNQGMQRNGMAALTACRGEYVAVLEGDDYWIDKNKISRQANFLDSHPDCVNCFHNVLVVLDNTSGTVQGYYPQANGSKVMCAPDTPDRFSQREFLIRNVIPTCSVMFRKSSVGELPAWFEKLPLGDQPLHILCTEHGLAAYLPDVMAAYRIHNGGFWSGSTEESHLIKTIEMYEILEKYYVGRPQSIVLRRCRLQFLWAYGRSLRKLGKYYESSVIARTYLGYAFNDYYYCLTHMLRITRMLFFSFKKH